MQATLIILLIAVLVIPFVLTTLDIKIGFNKEIPKNILWLVKILIIVLLVLMFNKIGEIINFQDNPVAVSPFGAMFLFLAIQTLLLKPPRTRR